MMRHSTIESPTLKLVKRVRARAIRCGAYYRVLTKVERTIIDLSIICKAKFRSMTLSMTVARILVKLASVIPPSLIERALALGRKLAARLAMLAYAWGNERALAWAHDEAFIRHTGLTMCQRPFAALLRMAYIC